MNQMEATTSKESGQPYQITAGVWMVPCRIDKSKKAYVPSIKPFKNVKKPKKPKRAFSRQGWSEQEDAALANLVTELGAANWSSIATQLNIKLHNGLPIRLGKQCRERWIGSLDPEIEKSEWSREEDNLLITQQLIHGNRWSLISECLPGRTENQIKNRWRKLDKLARIKRKENSREGFEQCVRFVDPWTLFCWPAPFY